MSTQIAPRPRAAQQPSRRPVTGPRSRRPAPSSPFRWRRDSPFPGVARDGAPRVHNSFTARNDLPDPGPWAATLAGAIVEVVTGVRQAQQLRRWLLPDLYAALTAVRLSPCARGTTLRVDWTLLKAPAVPVRARHHPRPRAHLPHRREKNGSGRHRLHGLTHLRPGSAPRGVPRALDDHRP